MYAGDTPGTREPIVVALGSAMIAVAPGVTENSVATNPNCVEDARLTSIGADTEPLADELHLSHGVALCHSRKYSYRRIKGLCGLPLAAAVMGDHTITIRPFSRANFSVPIAKTRKPGVPQMFQGSIRRTQSFRSASA